MTSASLDIFLNPFPIVSLLSTKAYIPSSQNRRPLLVYSPLRLWRHLRTSPYKYDTFIQILNNSKSGWNWYLVSSKLEAANSTSCFFRSILFFSSLILRSSEVVCSCYNIKGQFHQHVYVQLLRTQIPKAEKASWVDCLFFARKSCE